MIFHLLLPKFNCLEQTFKVTHHLAIIYIATLNAH